MLARVVGFLKLVSWFICPGFNWQEYFAVKHLLYDRLYTTMQANIALLLMIRALEPPHNLQELCSDDDAGVFPRPWISGKHQAVLGRMTLL